MGPRLDPADVALLNGRLAGSAVLPGEPGYEDARRAWNGMVEHRPLVAVRCASTGDVARAIAFARERGIEIGVKGGGHGILGQAIPDGGLLIELSGLADVRVDPASRTATVGGGALLGQLDRESIAHGLVTTAGNVSHTGVGGLTLGGGMGWLARRIGLACDNVLAFEVVTADGAVLAASPDENADLYWALRGGGGNFGVVTSFVFRLHGLPGPALSVDLCYRLADGLHALETWRDYANHAPPAATPTAWVGRPTDPGFLPEPMRGDAVLGIGFVWVGDPAEGRAEIATLRSKVGLEVLAELVDEVSYLELQTGGDVAMQHGRRRYWKSHYLNDLGPEAIATFLSRGLPGNAPPAPIEAGGFLQAYGGAIGEVGPDDTAFSHRDTRFEFVTMAGWDDSSEDEERMGACRRFARALEPYASGVYVNGLSDEGELGLGRAYRASTLDRLRRVKQRYDPDNVFHLNHNVVPRPVAPEPAAGPGA